MKKIYLFLFSVFLFATQGIHAQINYAELTNGVYYFLAAPNGQYFNGTTTGSDTKEENNIYILETAATDTYYLKRVVDNQYVSYDNTLQGKGNNRYYELAITSDKSSATLFNIDTNGWLTATIETDDVYFITGMNTTTFGPNYYLKKNGQKAGCVWTITEAPKWFELKDALAEAERYDIGSGLNQYSGTDTETFTSSRSSAQALTLSEATVEGVDDLISKLSTDQYSLKINQPQDGTFLRIENNGTYVSAPRNSNPMTLSSTADATNVFYYTEGKLICLATGYAGNGNGTAVGSETKYIFDNPLNGMTNSYSIAAANGNYWSANETVLGTSTTGTETGCNFTLTQLDVLPISMSQNTKGDTPDNKYYASICLPVAVTLPAGLKAYSATIGEDDKMILSNVAGSDKADDVLPANSPVILFSDNKVESLGITTSEATIESGDLLGTIEAETVEAKANYVLSISYGIGFYIYNNTTMPGFKAYLPASASTGSNSYKFVFDNNTPTGIDTATPAEELSGEYYDLLGNKVTTPVKGHIYIVNKKAILY